MDSLQFLAGTSVVLAAILGIMSQFIFRLPTLVSGAIAGTTMIGLFLIMLVFNNITFKRSLRYQAEE